MKETILTVQDIQLALYNSKIWNTRTDIFVTNLSWGLLDYEADFVVLNKSGYLTEVEIKRTWSDFLADFKKEHTHNDSRIYHFFYCLPISFKEKAIELLTEKFGNRIPAILLYDEDGKITRAGGISQRGGRKLFIEEQLTLSRLGTMRFWNLLNKSNTKH